MLQSNTKSSSKSIMNIFSLILITAIFMLTMAGCTPNPEIFSSTKISITLDNSFSKYSSDTYNLYVQSNDVGFSAREETIQQLELAGYEIQTLSDYADEILSLNGDIGIKLSQRDDYYYFITSQTSNGAKYTYVHCMYEGDNAFWVCQFVCKSKDYKRLKDDIFSWADTVEIIK